MVDVDKAVIAKLKKDGKEFEILVDCDKALEFKAGKPVSLSDVVAVDDIFKDVKKGEKASEHDLQSIFKTTDVQKISTLIIKEGLVQLTKEHLAKQREEKRKQIITIIHRNAVDPKTGIPHPPQRIESAMMEAKVHIDEHKSAEMQIDDIMKKIQMILPIKFEKKKVQVIIPAQYSGLCYNVLKTYHASEEWMDNGNLKGVVEHPAGIVDEFFGKLNSLCHGELEGVILS